MSEFQDYGFGDLGSAASDALEAAKASMNAARAATGQTPVVWGGTYTKGSTPPATPNMPFPSAAPSTPDWGGQLTQTLTQGAVDATGGLLKVGLQAGVQAAANAAAGAIPGMQQAYPGQQMYGQPGYGQQYPYGQQGMCPEGYTYDQMTGQCAQSSNMWLYLGGAAVLGVVGLLIYMGRGKSKVIPAGATPVTGFFGLPHRRPRRGLGCMECGMGDLAGARRQGRRFRKLGR